MAVYSDADFKNSMHVQQATEARYLVRRSSTTNAIMKYKNSNTCLFQGGNMSKDSYLRMDRLIQIAKDTGAQVVKLLAIFDFLSLSDRLSIRLYIRDTDSYLKIPSSLIWLKRLG